MITDQVIEGFFWSCLSISLSQVFLPVEIRLGPTCKVWGEFLV